MRPLRFIFEAEEETKVITIRRNLVNISGTFTAEKASFVCCWDVCVLLHQALLIFYIFFFNKEKWLPLNNIWTTGARHKFCFECCILFCICTGQTGVTRSDPGLSDLSLSCANELILKLQGVLASCQCAEAHCEPAAQRKKQLLCFFQVLQRWGLSLSSTHTVKQRRDSMKVGSCRHTHRQCLMNLQSPNCCFFAPKGTLCICTCTAP